MCINGNRHFAARFVVLFFCDIRNVPTGLLVFRKTDSREVIGLISSRFSRIISCSFSSKGKRNGFFVKFFPLLFVIVAAVLVAAEPNSPVSGAVTTSAAVVASPTPAPSLPAPQGAGANATPAPTHALIPDADAAEVLCIGDSITQKRYPSLLQKLLGKRFRVVDAGHSGTTALRDGNRPYRYDQMKAKPLRHAQSTLYA